MYYIIFKKKEEITFFNFLSNQTGFYIYTYIFWWRQIRIRSECNSGFVLSIRNDSFGLGNIQGSHSLSRSLTSLVRLRPRPGSLLLLLFYSRFKKFKFDFIFVFSFLNNNHNNNNKGEGNDCVGVRVPVTVCGLSGNSAGEGVKRGGHV